MARTKITTERFSSPTKQQERAAELKAQGYETITRYLGHARRSNQPQRTAATEGDYVVQYWRKPVEG